MPAFEVWIQPVLEVGWENWGIKKKKKKNLGVLVPKSFSGFQKPTHMDKHENEHL